MTKYGERNEPRKIGILESWQFRIFAFGLLVVGFFGIGVLQTNLTGHPSRVVWNDDLYHFATAAPEERPPEIPQVEITEKPVIKRVHKKQLEHEKSKLESKPKSKPQPITRRPKPAKPKHIDIEKCNLNASELVRLTLDRLKQRVHQRQSHHATQGASQIPPNNQTAKPLFITHKIPMVGKTEKGRGGEKELPGLGSWMFTLASLVGIAQSHNRIPIISEKSEPYVNYFEPLNIGYLQGEPGNSTMISEKGRGKFAVPDLSADKNVNLEGYFQSWKYFESAQNNTKSLFTFTKNVFEKSLGVLEKILTKYVHAAKSDDCPPVLVGIHVRAGDVGKKHNKELGYLPAPQKYYNNAVKHFQDKYRNVVFVVISNDPKHARKMFKKPNVLFVEGQPDGVDMAILSLMDHIVLSFGNFGWWGAYLSDAKEVVYNKNWLKTGSAMADVYNSEDYFPSSWTALEYK